ncbi:ubiquitin-like protein 7 isoform X2 [Haliotis rufescens]|uniref:ubiquitin-like protein 7 isoform X2 n=1 Tax=Haliotis rufescens TaxID=6454 RepID=UPI001EB06CF9|nr:ubiquitin-like protein 7 isoform X2 [Haliotis rufescens]
MAYINVRDRTDSGKTGRFRLQDVNIEGSVTNLLQEIAKKIEASKDDIELIYSGQRLLESRPLTAYGLRPGSTVYVLQKRIRDEPAAAASHTPSKAEIIAALQSDLLNPAYKSIVEKMLTDPDTIENIIAATPGLDSDPVAISMLQDPDLLTILAHPQNISKLLEKHPSFGNAAITIAAAVNEEGSKDAARVSTGTYSLDQMSDEEEDAGPPSGGASTSSANPSGGPPIISSDFFQQAMLQAQNAATEAQMQQLRDMGITDDNLARRALDATGGDIQAALELIFADQNT